MKQNGCTWTPQVILLVHLQRWNSLFSSINPACSAACNSVNIFHSVSSQMMVLMQLLLFYLNRRLCSPCYSSPTSVMRSLSLICNMPFVSATKLLLSKSNGRSGSNIVTGLQFFCIDEYLDFFNTFSPLLPPTLTFELVLRGQQITCSDDYKIIENAVENTSQN